MHRRPRANKTWAQRLAEFQDEADALPPGPAKDAMLQKVRQMQHAIDLRDSVMESHGHQQAQG